MSRRIIFSCVVDTHPKFRWQSFIFVSTLIHNCGIRPGDIYIHLIDQESLLETYLSETGVNVVSVGRWGTGNYCNKLAQFDSEALRDADYVFLCDCDLAFAGGIHEIAWKHPEAVAGKTVDADNPSLDILASLFRKYRCEAPAVVNTFKGKSFLTNCNGGLLGIPQKYFTDIGRAWREYAVLLLADADARSLLKEKVIHIDQISFAMALSRIHPSFIPLSVVYNTPIHCDDFLPGVVSSLDGETPHVLHYHNALDSLGLLKSVGQPQVDSAIEKVNDVLRREFCNRLFWDYRYAVDPHCGSGVGSRGELLTYKRKMLKCLGVENAVSVLDVGCGDGEVVSPLQIHTYTGIDISQQAINRVKTKRPDGIYFLYADRERAESADIVVCLDVLLHQDSLGDYHELIDFLVRKTKSRLIVSGYDRREKADASCMCRYFEDVRISLENTGQFRSIFKFSEYRSLAVLVADKDGTVFNTSENPNDIGDAILAQVLSEQGDNDSLLEIVTTSRAMFGWYSKHYPRVFEYPWILSHFGHDAKGKTIADFGAGISALPLLLSLRGASVVTLDDGRSVSLEDIARNNEWGFLDYSTVDSSIKSINSKLLPESFPSSMFDVWYSVSVIEHLPAIARREILRCIHTSMKPGGQIYLTVDLIKNSHNLWNHSNGREVEPREIHGSLYTLFGELRKSGFQNISAQTLPMPETERVDIALISATAVSSPTTHVATAVAAGGVSLRKPWHRAFRDLIRAERHISLIKKSGLFDSAWYEAAYPDVKQSGIDPVRHYVLYGWSEGRDPSVNFNTRTFLRQHPEIEASGTCPFVAYIANIDVDTIVPRQVLDLMEPFNFRSLYELGNKKTNGVSYHLYYRARGIAYTSIDLNGLDGALPLDLSGEIDLPARDAVVNIGTSEHVMNQESVFRNVHRLSRSRMIHWVPLAGKHPDHGFWGYDLRFFEKLALLNAYEIEKLYVETSFKNWSLVCCSLRRLSDPGKDFAWDKSLPLTFNKQGQGGVSYE